MRRGDLHQHLDASYHAPERTQTIAHLKAAWGAAGQQSIADLVEFHNNSFEFDPTMPYVGLANVASNYGELIESTDEVTGVCRRFKKGQLLYCKLRPYLNKVYLAQIDGQCSTEFYVMSIRDAAKLLPKYLESYLTSHIFLSQTKYMMTGNTHPRIQQEDFRTISVPIPPPEVQSELVAAMQAARERRTQRLRDADAELAGIDAFLLDALGLTPPPAQPGLVFAVKFGEIKRSAAERADYDFHTPRFRAIRQMIETGPFTAIEVGKICKLVTSGFAAGGDDQAQEGDEAIPHIRPLNITSSGEFTLDNTKSVPVDSVKAQDYLTQGEVLFNNTNSAVWVGKSTVFDSPTPCASSNHITRLVLKDTANPYYVAELFNTLRAVGLFSLMATHFNNQSGINSETLSALRIPLPPIEKQEEIAAVIQGRRDRARLLREDTAREWDAAKADFERRLLQGSR